MGKLHDYIATLTLFYRELGRLLVDSKNELFLKLDKKLINRLEPVFLTASRMRLAANATLRDNSYYEFIVTRSDLSLLFCMVS